MGRGGQPTHSQGQAVPEPNEMGPRVRRAGAGGEERAVWGGGALGPLFPLCPAE